MRGKKILLAHDLRPKGGGLVALMAKRKEIMVEPVQNLSLVSSSRPKYVVFPAFHDAHNHPALYGMIQGANPVDLGESTNKREIIKKIKARSMKDNSPILALSYSMEAGMTAKELDELGSKREILLLGTSLHAGVGNSLLLLQVERKVNERKIKGEIITGGIGNKGELSEGCFLTALEIAEGKIKEKIVNGINEWVMERIREGTTSITDKAVLTPAEWGALKISIGMLKQKLGYNPIAGVYFYYNSFKGKLKECISEANDIGIKTGVKWVGDGGTTSATASLENFKYADGSRGLEPTIPIDYRNPRAVEQYIRELKEARVSRMAFHAIGDKTIGIALDFSSILRKNGIELTICHLEVPTFSQIKTAAREGIFLDMQPAYSSEGLRYPATLGELTYYNNPVGTVLREYSANGFKGRVQFSTDGMPSDMLGFGTGCAVGHPIVENRISLGDYLENSRDIYVQDGAVILTTEAFKRIMEMQDTKILAERAGDIQETIKNIHKGVLAVCANGKTIYRKSELI
ncbi:amidohydrolase family protein [Candidatus Micrarchaeota archaeon]|nr:amidohydrolase family protein [Candidatus Micrarchaeota archaeon]